MKLRFNFIFIFLLILLSLSAYSENQIKQSDIEIELSEIIVSDIKTEIKLTIVHPYLASELENKILPIKINGKNFNVQIEDYKGSVEYVFKSKETILISTGDYKFEKEVNPIPLCFSIIPPLIAILIALLFKEVFSALFIGLLFGTSIIAFYQEGNFVEAVFVGFLSIIDTYILESLTKSEHMAIIVFSMLIGAMVNLISRNGGMKGVVDRLSKHANNPRSGQFVTWALGIVIFFDDYANTLVVGNTMRPVTDKLKISREKLSYIVDSTAAPIAAIAFVTTWVGAELGYIQNGIDAIGINETPYNVFFNSLQYSFYPILALMFIPILIYKKREFGPMLKAERKARASESIESLNQNQGFSNNITDLEVSKNVKTRSFNAVIPVAVVIFGTIAGLYYTGVKEVGANASLSDIIGNADSFTALLWASISSVFVAIVLTLSQKLLTLKESVDSIINGFRTMLTAIVILVLAWSIALITKHMHTADFISQMLVSIQITPFLVPALTFIMAALVAFSTGSSWGTMAILYPLILPASWLISQNYGLDTDQSLTIFYNVVSTVLAGSVLGDHCSPISDTTILSSLASSCNHIEHVRTQLPYALTIGLVSIVVGTIPAAYGVSSWILFPLSLIILYLIIQLFGKKINT